MTDREALLAAIVAQPADGLAWLALADWLEDDGESQRAELLRLSRQLRGLPRRSRKRPALEQRLCGLLSSGVRPCVPERVNSIGMRFALVPPGTFWMGSPEDEEGREDEPLREVTFERAYWVGMHTVTQEQFQRVTRRRPSTFREKGEHGDQVEGMDTSAFPVEGVSWDNVATFLARLRSLDGGEAQAYRLPTESEWEYACRAGTTTPFHCGPTLTSRQANIREGDSLERTCAVGSYPPNAFGLYDAHGNVWEMCRNGEEDEDTDSERALRGGCYEDPPETCRAAKRLAEEDDDDEAVQVGDDLGFRVVMEWRS